MRALLFDVVGTCVDWRTPVNREAERLVLPGDIADAGPPFEADILAWDFLELP